MFNMPVRLLNYKIRNENGFYWNVFLCSKGLLLLDFRVCFGSVYLKCLMMIQTKKKSNKCTDYGQRTTDHIKWYVKRTVGAFGDGKIIPKTRLKFDFFVYSVVAEISTNNFRLEFAHIGIYRMQESRITYHCLRSGFFFGRSVFVCQ